jgi:hypothetical protein
MSSFSKPLTENSLSGSPIELLHWYSAHWSTEDTETPTFTDIHMSGTSVKFGVPVLSVLWCTRCQCGQCFSGLTEDEQVTVFEYFHWYCSSLIEGFINVNVQHTYRYTCDWTFPVPRFFRSSWLSIFSPWTSCFFARPSGSRSIVVLGLDSFFLCFGEG